MEEKARKGSQYFPGKIQKPENVCLKSTQFVIKHSPEVITSELPEFKFYDYGFCPLSMQCPFSIVFIVHSMSKHFAAHVTTSSMLRIVEKIFCLFIS